MMIRYLAAALFAAFTLVSPAAAFEVQSTAVSGRIPSTLCGADPRNLMINRADGTLSFCDPSGAPKTRVLLNPAAALASQLSNLDVSGMRVAAPDTSAAAGTLSRLFGDLSGLKAPGASGFARLDAGYFTANTRALFNSDNPSGPTNWLGTNLAEGSATSYGFGGYGQIVALSGLGDVGISAATRTEDITTNGRFPAAGNFQAFNYKTTSPLTAWGLYGECNRAKGAGQCHGAEINVTDLGDGSDRIIPTAKATGPNAAYASYASGLNLGWGGNITPGQQTRWNGNKVVTQAANIGVGIAMYGNAGPAQAEKGIIIAENALVGCGVTGGSCTAVEVGRGAGFAWIDGTTRQAARISSDISPAGPATKLTFTDAGLYLDQGFSNAGAFSLANGFFGVGTIAPSSSLSSFASMTVPGSTGQYIDNVLTLQNLSSQSVSGKAQRGNAAINIRDHLGQERAAFGYSHTSNGGASVGFISNLAYVEGGNLTTDTENTHIGWVFTYPANAARFGGGTPSRQYQVLRADAGTGNVQISRYDGLYSHEFDATNRLTTFYGGDASGLSGNHLRFAPGSGSTPAAISSFRQDGGATDLVVGGSGGGMVQVQGGVKFTTAYTVASLPTCNAANKGLYLRVDDYNGSPTYNGGIGSGGGSTSLPTYCNGSYWAAR